MFQNWTSLAYFWFKYQNVPCFFSLFIFNFFLRVIKENWDVQNIYHSHFLSHLDTCNIWTRGIVSYVVILYTQKILYKTKQILENHGYYIWLKLKLSCVKMNLRHIKVCVRCKIGKWFRVLKGCFFNFFET